MRMYKTTKIEAAVKALKEYHNAATESLAELERQKQRYSPEVYQEKEKDADAKFAPFYNAAKKAVEEAVADLEERARKSEASFLTIGSAEEDYKLLQLHPDLTSDELITMVKRNEGNGLFARAVSRYAKERGYTGPNYKFFDYLSSNRSPYRQEMREAQDMRTILEKCLVSDKLQDMRNCYKGRFLDNVERAGIFTKEV